MIHDAACPPGLDLPVGAIEREGVFYTSAQWTGDSMASLIGHLIRYGPAALRGSSTEDLRSAWNATVADFLDPRTPTSSTLRPTLSRFCQLSPAGLDAAFEAILGGVGPSVTHSLFDQARPRGDLGLVTVFLAGNLPALAVQPLLPAMALRRPVLLKSPSSEPLFAAAFVRALHDRLPELAHAVAATTWKGGDLALETAVLARSQTVVVYGDANTVSSLEAQVGDRCLAYGPKVSIAIVDREACNSATADGLASDIALLDQRGCLSIQAVYTDGDARELADLLAAALVRRAEAWPAGPPNPVAAAGVHQLRTDARMRGLHQPSLDLAVGTVIVEPLGAFQPSPGLRTVRVHPVEAVEGVPELLSPWRGSLQGAALAGERAWTLETTLAGLEISRCASPGSLQSPDALWHNGGRHPLEALGG